MRIIPQFAINRPASMIVLMAAILIMGYMNFSRLPVDLLPEMDLPIAAVITTYQGAGPEEVEDQVTKLLESAMGTIGGIDTLSSTSSANSSIVIVQFKYGTNMDNAMVDIRDNVSMVESALPDGVKPMVIKFDPNMMPVIQLTLGGDYSLAELQSMAEDDFETRLARIPEVASVTITGGREREIKIDIDPVKAANYGLSLNQIANVLQQENYNLSSGNLSYGERKYVVRGMQRFESLEDVENVALTTAAGNQIFLKDVAAVESGYKDITQITRVNGEYAVGIHCQKEADANTVAACEAVKAEIEKIKQENHLDVDVNIVMDQSDYITRSISSTGRMMLEGGILAVLIILFFLRNLSSTLIIAISIPMSIIATFIVMYYTGSTINMITLGGLALGVGRIVDDSIVVFENIYRHRTLGKSAFEAALDGTTEVGGAVIACTLTLMAVFIPIGLTEGIAGVLFKPLATTIAVAIFCSLVVSLTIVPFLASRILSDRAMEKRNLGQGVVRKSVDGLGNFLESLDNVYKKMIVWALGHRKMVVAAATLLMVISIALAPRIGAEFMPASDSGSISISIEADKGTSIEDMEQLTKLAEEKLLANPLVDVVFVSIGSAGTMSMDSAVNMATVSVNLIPLAERREHSAQQVADELGKVLGDEIPGVKVSSSASSEFGGGTGSGGAINVSVRGDDLTTLRGIAEDVEAVIKKVPGTREVSSSLSDGDPEVQVRINRKRAADFGLTPRQVSNEVRNAIDGLVVSKYHDEGKEVDIRLINWQGTAKNMETLTGLKLLTPAGSSIPLSDVATFDLTRGPVSISRTDQVRQANVSGDILNRDLNSVMSDVRAQLDEMPLPSGYEIVYSGQDEQMMESFSSLFVALLLAIMLVYVVLVIQYESFFDPFVIFFSIPTAFVGVVFSLLITGRTFSVNSFIGVIMLVGIVVANAILFIDYLKQQRAKGMERNEALVLTGGTRLRPILMTSFCTMLAMVPMATGLAEGSELNSPLATVVIGGLLVSTFVTLILVPVVYSIFDDIGNRIKARRERKRQAREARRNKSEDDIIPEA